MNLTRMIACGGLLMSCSAELDSGLATGLDGDGGAGATESGGSSAGGSSTGGSSTGGSAAGGSSAGGSASGGTTGNPEPKPYISGSRIRARTLETAGGAKQFNGWYDLQFSANCVFTLASDGKTRCLPGTYWIGADYFSDPSCANFIAGVTQCTDAEYIVARDNTTCGAGSEVWETTGLHTGNVYMEDYQSNCIELPAISAASFDFYRVSTVNISSFAAATEVIE